MNVKLMVWNGQGNTKMKSLEMLCQHSTNYWKDYLIGMSSKRKREWSNGRDKKGIRV